MNFLEINDFLHCSTPSEWLAVARLNRDTLLIDHANCEKKAAATALNLMFRYINRSRLLEKMSKLAREELRHFEQVLAIMKGLGIEYGHISASRYAEGLRKHVRRAEPDRLIDTLIVGAYIEARSCERFGKLAPLLEEPQLAAFYRGLMASESRHYRDYLMLAHSFAEEPIQARIDFFGETEADLITAADTSFRFHSGTPAF